MYLGHFTNASVLVAVELVTTTMKHDGVDVDSVVIVVVNLGLVTDFKTVVLRKNATNSMEHCWKCHTVEAGYKVILLICTIWSKINSSNWFYGPRIYGQIGNVINCLLVPFVNGK